MASYSQHEAYHLLIREGQPLNRSSHGNRKMKGATQRELKNYYLQSFWLFMHFLWCVCVSLRSERTTQKEGFLSFLKAILLAQVIFLNFSKSWKISTGNLKSLIESKHVIIHHQNGLQMKLMHLFKSSTLRESSLMTHWDHLSINFWCYCFPFLALLGLALPLSTKNVPR